MIEAFAQVGFYNRQVGEGRSTQDMSSYVVALPTSASMISGLTITHSSPALVYGAGTLPSVGTDRELANSGEVPTRALVGRWGAAVREMCGPLGSPVPELLATPNTTPIFAGKSLALPAVYSSPSNPRISQAMASSAVLHSILSASTQGPLNVPGLVEAADPFNFVLQLKYMLLEPPLTYADLTLWQLWSIDEILSNINRRLERFCLETGITKKVTQIGYFDIPQPVQGNYLIPTDSLDVRRVSYKQVGGSTVPLKLADQHTLANGLGLNWQSLVGSPIYWLKDFPNAGQIKVVPAPILSSFAPSTITYHYVPRPAKVTLADFNALAPIPPCLLPYIRWGVLSDLLSKQGEANDPIRQAYCDQRWQEGIEVTKALLGRLV